MININFDSLSLKIDYLSFNFQFNNLEQIQVIADFLETKLSCKSTLLDQSNQNKRKRILTEVNKTRYSAEFIINSNKHWKGTTLRFKGKSAQCFYQDFKFLKLNWSIFDLNHTNLGRVDLCYDRKLKPVDEDLNIFFQNSCEQINKTKSNRIVKISSNILRIGKRSSSNFFRVYLRTNGRDVRFELELKKTMVKKFQHYLFTNQFERFEELLACHFYHQTIQLFDMESNYTDWLRVNFRQVRKKPYLSNYFSTSYLYNKPISNLTEIKFIYQLIQLLNFIKIKSIKNGSKEILISGQGYESLKFPANEFLEFIGQSKDNYYQLKKLIEFFKSLQTMKPIIENFSDFSFRSYVAFPFLKVERTNNWCWYIEFLVCRKLLIYDYPFHLPNTFFSYRNNLELKVRFAVLQSLCNPSLQKEFASQRFLKQVSLSNSKSASLKIYIVEVLHSLQDSRIIEAEFRVLTKQNRFQNVKRLTSSLVSRSESIFYKENVYI